MKNNFNIQILIALQAHLIMIHPQSLHQVNRENYLRTFYLIWSLQLW